MRFLDNHDWHPHRDWGWGNGWSIDQSGGMPQVAPLMVLCATLPGKPLLYNGQEMAFVKTDPVDVVQGSALRRANVVENGPSGRGRGRFTRKAKALER